MEGVEFKMRGKVWLYSSEKAAWHFISLPKGKSKDMRDFFSDFQKGFKSLRVEVKIGNTSWKTSIFPDSKREAYILPLKAIVRKKENIKEGDSVLYSLKVLV